MVRNYSSIALVVCVSASVAAAPSGDTTCWQIQGSLFSSTSRDTQNFMGVSADALSGLDSRDVLHPPRLSGRLCLRIEDDDGRPRALDLRPPLIGSHFWTLKAAALEAGAFHFILFSGLDSVPQEYTVVLRDPVAGVRLDLRVKPEYLFLPRTGEAERTLQLEVTNPAPLPPKTLSATMGETGVDLWWDDQADPDVIGYKVYMGTTSGAYEQSWTVGMQCQYEVTDVEYGHDYYFAVSAVDRSQLEGETSREARVSLVVVPTPTPIPPPAMTFDMDHNGRIDNYDLFTLAGSWMAPILFTPEGKRPYFQSVSPTLLGEFAGEWRKFRTPPTSMKPTAPTMETVPPTPEDSGDGY